MHPTVLLIIDEVFFSGTMPNLKKYAFDNKYNGAFNTILFLIDVVLRGISQVYLCDNPVSGILICIGLGMTSYSLVGYALLGTFFATLGAYLIAQPDVEDITSGLCGYDGALVGCACWAFLAERQTSIAIVLSFFSGFVHVSCTNFMKTFGIPTFTFSFNICTSALLMAISTKNSAVSSFPPSPPPPPAEFANDSKWATSMSPSYLADMSIRGVGQFMFADTTEGGVLVILGIMVASRIGGLAAWLGGTVGGLTAFYVVNVPMNLRHLVRKGIFGYCSAGCCASLAGKVFFEPSYMGVVVGISGAVLACIFQVAFMSFFNYLYSLPVLTWPFITSTWVVIMTRSKWLVPIVSNSRTISDPFLRFIGIDKYFFSLSVAQQVPQNPKSWERDIEIRSIPLPTEESEK
jgi:urea transporter